MANAVVFLVQSSTSFQVEIEKDREIMVRDGVIQGRPSIVEKEAGASFFPVVK